jgi:hypothetical protein
MKYWDSGLNAPGSRTFIVQYTDQQWLVESVQEKKDKDKLSLSPNLLLNWISCPVEAQCTFFSCFLKSRPLCDQTGPNRGFRAVFASLYGWLYWQGFYRALDLFQKQLPGSNSMQLRIRFLVTLIKTPRSTLFPSFNRWLLALQRTFSGLHKWQQNHGVDCWLYKGHFRTPQMTARPWSRLLALQRTFQDTTNDSTTMDGSRWYGKTLICKGSLTRQLL